MNTSVLHHCLQHQHEGRVKALTNHLFDLWMGFSAVNEQEEERINKRQYLIKADLCYMLKVKGLLCHKTGFVCKGTSRVFGLIYEGCGVVHAKAQMHEFTHLLTYLIPLSSLSGSCILVFTDILYITLMNCQQSIKKLDRALMFWARLN